MENTNYDFLWQGSEQEFCINHQDENPTENELDKMFYFNGNSYPTFTAVMDALIEKYPEAGDDKLCEISTREVEED